MPSVFEQKILPLFEETRAQWLERARRAAIELAGRKGDITIDDVREVCPPPEGCDPRVMGAVFRPKSDWDIVKYRPSERGHGRAIAVFRRRSIKSAHAAREKADQAALLKESIGVVRDLVSKTTPHPRSIGAMQRAQEFLTKALKVHPE